MTDQALVVSVSEFVALLNGTLEYAFPSVTVVGELSNFRVSKNRWVYFDLKDEEASVKCFGTVYQLAGPLEDGMLLEVRAQPRLHQLYGFSLNVISIRLSGEGTIRRANELLAAKLAAEGLFDETRKRSLPFPPSRIALITSSESAAYVDFMKILNARWRGVTVQLADVQVQGEAAPEQLVTAIRLCNDLAVLPEVIVITRGGGSSDDLAAFNDERVVRAIAASRVPTLVAIGHEIDTSFAELAADVRASTPSNAAELLVPDRAAVQRFLGSVQRTAFHALKVHMRIARDQLDDTRVTLQRMVLLHIQMMSSGLEAKQQLLAALSPHAVLKRGYAVVRASDKRLVRRADEVRADDMIELQFYDGTAHAIVKEKGRQ